MMLISVACCLQRLQRLTAEAGEWARDYRARQRAAATTATSTTPSQQQAQQQQQQSNVPNSLRIVPESSIDAPIAALAAYSQSGQLPTIHHLSRHKHLLGLLLLIATLEHIVL